MKIKANECITTEIFLNRSWRLKNSEKYKQIYVMRNMTEDERMRVKEMINEAKIGNEKRSEEE